MTLGGNPGLVGALFGLGLGVVKYMLVLSMISTSVGREIKRGSENMDLAGFSARMRPVRWALLVGAFGVLPAIGYAAGRLLGN